MPLLTHFQPYGLGLPIAVDDANQAPFNARAVEDSKWGAIALTVGAPVGSRLMRRNRGGYAYGRLFSTTAELTAQSTAFRIAGEITAQVTDVLLEDVSVVANETTPEVKIRYRVRGSETTNTYELNIQRSALLGAP